MRKKLIAGIALICVLVLALVFLRSCGTETAKATPAETVWSMENRVVMPYADAYARYVWPAYDGEDTAYPADMTVLALGDKEVGPASKTAVPYKKECALELAHGGIYTLEAAYKSVQVIPAATAAPKAAEGAEPTATPEPTAEPTPFVALDTAVVIKVDGAATHEIMKAYILKAAPGETRAQLVDENGQPLRFRLGGGKHVVSIEAAAGGVEVSGVTATAVETYNEQATLQVKESGLYALTITYQNDTATKGDTALTLKIDGGVPFAEMDGYRLASAAESASHTFADASGAPYLFSLTEGEHTITLSAASGGVQVTGFGLSSTLMPLYAGEDVRVDANLQLVLDHANPAIGKGEVTINVPEDARYEIWLTYRNTADTTLPTELGVAIDGEIVSEEMQRVKLSSLWVDNGEILADRYGNQIAAIPEAVDVELTAGIGDSAGRTADPLLFALAAGSHTLSFEVKDGGCDITAVTLKKATEVPAYAAGDASGDQLITIEAEQIASRNESSIRGAGEFNAQLTPYSNDDRMINFLDGASFDEAGEMVTWKFNVEKAGWYYLGAYYRQNARADFPTYVDVLIDGVIPSAAAEKVAFPYTTSFTYMQAKDAAGEPLTYYLEAGEHELSFRINAECMTPVYKTIGVLLDDINTMSNDIKALMGGAAADPYRDYNMDVNFPNLVDTLNGWADDCSQMVAYISAYSDNGGSSAFSSMTLCADQLRRLAEEPEDLPRRMAEFSTGANSAARMLAQQLTDMANNDLSIDQVYFYQADAKLESKGGFFKNLWEGAVRFFTSFVSQDYSASSATEKTWKDPETGEEYPVIQVWVGRSRQYVELMQQMADTTFFEETGIRVNLSLMPDANKLVLANAAGTAPDAVLGLQYVVPSYLNIRGALYDLSRIDDLENADGSVTPGFGAVAQRFSEGLFVPYILKDGVYAMPETVNFWVMFYRSDVLDTLQIEVPNSMDEVKLILPELQRRSMNFYFPTAGMSGMKVFPGTLPLILQAGGSIYDTEIGNTTLDSDISLVGFREMTELFTIYNMPTDVPSPGFYQQFRDGTLPIGIADLATYNLLLNAAPELDGLWDIALFPGLEQKDAEGNPILDENGDPVVARWTTGGAETMAIMTAAEEHGNVENSWKFLEWWSRAETQSTFGNLLQSTYGSEYIWPTANTEAFAQLPLKSSHKSVIIGQMDWMTEAPWVLGTYMLERELSNAFISVTADGVEARRAMDTAVKRINRETFRKLEEFGYYADGEMLETLKTPNAQVITDAIEAYKMTHATEPAGTPAAPAAQNTTEEGTAE